MLGCSDDELSAFSPVSLSLSLSLSLSPTPLHPTPHVCSIVHVCECVCAGFLHFQPPLRSIDRSFATTSVLPSQRHPTTPDDTRRHPTTHPSLPCLQGKPGSGCRPGCRIHGWKERKKQEARTLSTGFLLSVSVSVFLQCEVTLPCGYKGKSDERESEGAHWGPHGGHFGPRKKLQHGNVKRTQTRSRRPTILNYGGVTLWHSRPPRHWQP